MKAASTITIPQNFLEKEAYSLLPAQQKEEYTHNILKEFLKLNPIGLTISDIKKNFYLSHSVIWHHLEILSSRGECLRIERGDTDVYHLNKVIDTLKEFDIQDASEYHFSYNFDFVENPFGRFLRIQRLRESRSEAHTTRAGIIIPNNLVGTIADTIAKIKKSHLKGKHLNKDGKD